MCGCNTAGVMAKAVMCAVCPNRDGFTHCTLDGRPMLSRPCPIGRHPDAKNVVKWAGLEWYGVPYPIRWAMRRKWFRRLVGAGSLCESKFMGCGCHVPLKDEWERFRGR